MYVIDFIYYISVTMGALSVKVIIVIIACVSVLVISSIVIPIVAIYSDGETETTNGAGAIFLF